MQAWCGQPKLSDSTQSTYRYETQAPPALLLSGSLACWMSSVNPNDRFNLGQANTCMSRVSVTKLVFNHIQPFPMSPGSRSNVNVNKWSACSNFTSFNPSLKLFYVGPHTLQCPPSAILDESVWLGLLQRPCIKQATKPKEINFALHTIRPKV